MLPTFGDLLRQYRVAAGYSQEHLAAKARISVESVGALERGVRRAPYRDTVALLVAALELGEMDRRDLVAAADRGRARATSKPSARPFGASRLPIQTTSFVGRTDEMSAITRLLESNRLVTVTGSGGVGKTRIVLELASRSNNPRWREAIFVDLSPLNDGSFIAGAIAAAVLGSAATASSMESLINSLRAVDALVIIASNQAPGVLVEIGIEPRQHHCAMRQLGDCRDQFRGRRDRTGRTGCDHRTDGVAC